MPIITVQSKPGTYGHCTTAKVWQRKNGGAYELNIAAEVLNYPIEETLDTMLHEMVHLYCRENGIKEVSRGGKYHNGRFKAIAEAHGLTCVPCGQYGWNTTPGENLVEYALSKAGMKSASDEAALFRAFVWERRERATRGLRTLAVNADPAAQES